MSATDTTMRDAAKCMMEKCESEMKALLRYRFEGLKSLRDRGAKLHSEREQLGEKQFVKLMKAWRKDYEQLSKESTKHETNLKLQMCSMEKCQKENMENFKVLSKLYEDVCKKTKDDSCKLEKMAKSLVKQGSVTGKAAFEFLIKEEAWKSVQKK